MGDVRMIRLESVLLPALTFTWDGSIEDAKEILDELQKTIPGSVGSANFRRATNEPNLLYIGIIDLTEMGTTLYMREGDTATIVIDPSSAEAIWTIPPGGTAHETIVLQESRTALGS